MPPTKVLWIEGLFSNPWYYREVVKHLGGRAWWEKFRLLGTCPWRNIGTPLPASLLPPSHNKMSSFASLTAPYHNVLLQYSPNKVATPEWALPVIKERDRVLVVNDSHGGMLLWSSFKNLPFNIQGTEVSQWDQLRDYRICPSSSTADILLMQAPAKD